MAFLTARWSKLMLVTYRVEESILAPHVPPGCVLDKRDGHAFVSLVAFDFLDTRVLGIPWPGYRSFPEINLRYYVRHGEQRGVAFIREFVPSRAVAFLARRLYNEPYKGTRMTSTVTHQAGRLRVAHALEDHSTLAMEAGATAFTPPTDSTEHFFKEHSWGFGTSRAGKLLRYEVKHPLWAIYPVEKLELNWDWARAYGEKWKFLGDTAPDSTILAEGSAIAVHEWTTALR